MASLVCCSSGTSMRTPPPPPPESMGPESPSSQVPSVLQSAAPSSIARQFQDLWGNVQNEEFHVDALFDSGLPSPYQRRERGASFRLWGPASLTSGLRTGSGAQSRIGEGEGEESENCRQRLLPFPPLHPWRKMRGRRRRRLSPKEEGVGGSLRGKVMFSFLLPPLPIWVTRSRRRRRKKRRNP